MTVDRALSLRTCLSAATVSTLILLTACTTATPTLTVSPTETITHSAPSPTATSYPTATPVPEPTATLVPVPPLTRETLKNAAYPNEWPTGGVAQLVDGVYREKYLPDSATEMIIRLSHLIVHGDLNADGAADAAAVLVADPGGSGTFYYLAAVLNQNGTPKPVASQFLGDRVFIRSFKVEDGNVVIELDISGPEDPACCPTDSKRFTYRLEGDQLVEVGGVDLPDPEISAWLDNPPQRVEFEPGATSVTREEHIGFNRINGYLLRALAGQTMTVTVTSPHDDVWLSIWGYEDGMVLVSIFSEVNHWTGTLLSPQDYLINAVAVGGDTAYTLQIEIVGQPEPTVTPPPAPTTPPEPTATPATEPTVAAPPPSGAVGRVVHLTFDDGPTDPQWTPQVLEVLARYNARATFFVLGQLVQRFPDLIQAEAAAGHAVANHTYDHHTLDGICREAFFQEIQDTEAALGDWGTKCLRPPYGAIDAYTRAYAAELGYSIIMWDIDTRDWQRPGADVIASNVVAEVFPGAVVLFHDGGGDRSQTVAALEVILKTLSEQGYVFEVVCP